MQYSSKIHVMVRKPEDWEKMRDYETELEFVPELLDFMGGNAFDINQKSFIIDGEWSCNEDELEGLVMEIADKLEDSCLIFASTTNIDVDLILSISVYTFFPRMFDLMLPLATKHSIALV